MIRKKRRYRKFPGFVSSKEKKKELAEKKKKLNVLNNIGTEWIKSKILLVPAKKEYEL